MIPTKATQEDVPRIMWALLCLLNKSPAPQMKYADYDVAEASIRRAVDEGRAWLIHGYFIMVDVGSDWYTAGKYLIEQIILRVDREPHPVNVAVHALDYLKAHFDCVAIVVGDTQIGHMTPIYEAEGYKFLGTQLIKEN